MKKMPFLLVGLWALFSVYPAFGVRFERGESVRISQPVHEDIYVLSGTISINAPVYGDIWCAGGTVTLSDTVQGDIVLMGGTVNVRGYVAESVRAAGGTLTLSGSIGGDLLVMGGTITVERSAVVAGDIAVAGGDVTLDGAVRGDVKAATGKLNLNGSIEKGLEFNGDQLHLNGSVGGSSVFVANKLVLGNNAALSGNVRYWTSGGEVDFGNALREGATATFDTSLKQRFERPDYKFLGFASVAGVLWYLLAMLVLLWAGQRLFSNLFSRAAEMARAEPVRALGYGFLYFIAVPAVVVLLFITLIGIPLGAVIIALYFLLLSLANVITALVATHALAQQRGYRWSAWLYL
ncbi:MAG: hypothetical protein RMJ33_12870, partial [Saprospiraceae bacterium]|nr:hypothetical protein [Saprospiraceae bacterium]